MAPHSMSSELVELENRLRARPDDAEESGDQRSRVMAAVAVELAKPRQSSSAGQWDVRYWAAAAAAVLIVLNLSLICASQDEFSVWPMRDANQMTVELQAIRQVEARQEGTFK
jgi:hypothetical protein